MSEQRTSIPFPAVRREGVLREVKELAKSTFNVGWTDHALKRLEDRGITTRQEPTTLRQGRLEAPPEIDQYGGWQVILIRRSAGRRVRVVAVLSEKRLRVVTVTN